MTGAGRARAADRDAAACCTTTGDRDAARASTADTRDATSDVRNSAADVRNATTDVRNAAADVRNATTDARDSTSSATAARDSTADAGDTTRDATTHHAGGATTRAAADFRHATVGTHLHAGSSDAALTTSAPATRDSERAAEIVVDATRALVARHAASAATLATEHGFAEDRTSWVETRRRGATSDCVQRQKRQAANVHAAIVGIHATFEHSARKSLRHQPFQALEADGLTFSERNSDSKLALRAS